jgi:pimeloyl-ACP methyl ester carboxylesterase
MNPVLLLHGALGSQSQLDPLKKLLEARGIEVHSLNFSGHSGNPFRDTFGIAAFAEDVFHFLQSNKISSVDIFGYSMGGYVAIWLTHIHPELIGKIVTLGTKFDWSPESAAKEIKKLNPDKILEKIPAFARILEHRHSPNDWKELLHKTSSMMTDLGNNPLLTKEILQSITHPVTVLLGDADDMADRTFSEEVASLLPNGNFHLLENTPHPIEKTDVELLSTFLLQ